MSKGNLLKKIKGSPIEKDTFVLPYDILFEILIKVQVASLLRFKSISKSWNALISDVVFTKAHRDLSKMLGCEKLLLRRSTGEFDFVNLKNSNKITIEKQLFPPKGFLGANVLCSCDGLVLLKKPKAYKKFVLWNPSSGEHRILECPYMKPHGYTYLYACGLCYDSTTNDYKVILIYWLFYAMYSTSKDSWTTKTTPRVLQQCLYESELALNSRSYMCSQGIANKNRVYWSVNQKLNYNVRKTCAFIDFDVTLDEFKEFPIPTSTSDHENFFRLSTLKGRLSAYGGNGYFNELNIWIMKQDGWKWLMSICNIPTFYSEPSFSNYKLLCCTENDDLIFQGPKHHILSIYCTKQKQFVSTTYISNHLEYVFCPVDPICLDSLYFPKLNVTRKRKRRSTPSE
ncbi:putative F-box protein At3g25460 [Lycium ferocissimum]|uniref:putative F-box protein At3g25460 n=1 Tax=Lycium ferocissimum TaxID=112874 RepID=UPI002815C10B|nr:putative F-box protein At3g25460 [Lycium ferocissimum]